MGKDEFMRKVTFDYNYTFEQARQLWRIAEGCLGPSLIIGGTTGDVMGAAAGTVTVGTMTLPVGRSDSWVDLLPGKWPALPAERKSNRHLMSC